jgi:hypothetical protein
MSVNVRSALEDDLKAVVNRNEGSIPFTRSKTTQTPPAEGFLNFKGSRPAKKTARVRKGVRKNGLGFAARFADGQRGPRALLMRERANKSANTSPEIQRHPPVFFRV